MVARFVVAVWAILIAACYDLPRPDCGFACGPRRECPAGYVCNDFGGDNRCHPEGMLEAECEPAPYVDVPDPRPRVIENSLLERAVDPSLTLIEIRLSRPVSGVNARTFRLVRDDGVEVAVRRGTSDIEALLTMQLDILTFEVGRMYTLSLDGNLIDEDGYRLVPYHYMFRVITDRPPSISQRTPGIDDTNVRVNHVSSFELDEPVIGLDPLDFELYRGDSVVPTFAEVPIEYVGVNLYPVKQLLAFTTYTLVLLPGFADVGGNAFPGESWSFTTGADDVRPSVNLRPDFDEQVTVDRTIEVEFDEHVTPIDASSIVLEDALSGTLVDAEVSYDPINFIAYVNPVLQLMPNRPYRVRVTSQIHDVWSNHVIQLESTFFTIDDTVGPRIRSTSPDAESTGAPRTGPIRIELDEAVMPPGATDFVVRANGSEVTGTTSLDGTRAWQFVPDQPLPASSEIRVELVVRDQYFNTMTYSYLFTTGA